MYPFHFGQPDPDPFHETDPFRSRIHSRIISGSATLVLTSLTPKTVFYQISTLVIFVLKSLHLPVNFFSTPNSTRRGESPVSSAMFAIETAFLPPGSKDIKGKNI